MAAATAKYYFRFRICWCHCFQKVKVYQQTKFRQDTSIGGWYISTYAFEIQTSAILELYFRFRSRPVRRNLHVILYQATEFRPNRNTDCGHMTSYPFFNMAAATAKYYFRFRICWCHCLQQVKIYQRTKFRRDISIGGWDITTSGFEIQTSAVLDFYFRFWSRPFRRNRCVILQPAAEFCPNQNIRRWNMTSYRFSRWRPSVPFVVWIPSSNRYVGLIVPEILRCIFFVLAWNCIYTPILGVLANIFLIWPQKDHPWVETRHLSHLA